METTLASETIGSHRIELVRTSFGYQCRTYTNGRDYVLSSSTYEPVARQAFDRHCTNWHVAAGRSK